MEQEKGRLAVVRIAGHYRDAARAYKIEIDGDERGVVRPGQEFLLEVAPGKHRVRARIGWTGSPTVTVEVVAGEATTLYVEPAGPASTGIFQLFGTTSYLSLTE